ncbi:Interferon-induced very large GTPase 1 [Holothuria leucospilota]|uniref:Interferon-induced very large GTPase 1 n=1 Tax=Holothuria leucospilota TaxID=206669 RepID=A0A9Q0YKE7_HOLLE|nr:Interferon-induced very large GTPase 1 [Holothuria leucospilota]
MVTLAMCVADLMIVNIEGENIGSDMTNFLQIAAYALIRMKEVDLQSQCRIIQRVSDITESAKNKTNMLKIISTLDKAVENVAEAEGFVDRYESFSDIFKLNVNDHTQYVCNLWSGNMNPPNHLYGKVVIKFKEEIFDTISSGKLKIHFTLKTFGDRLIAVHEALKEENFVLKFEDVSRANTYNDFRLHCNNWLCDIRVKVKASWLTWQRRMGTAESNEREQLCENFKDELAEEMNKYRKTINEQFKSYIQNNENAKLFYNEYFSSWIEASLSKIECDIQIKISNEVKALQWASRDIPSFVLKEARKIRLKATEKATSLRENGSEQIDPLQLQQYFDEYWEDTVTSILETFQSKRVSKENIMEECTSILIKLCNGNAIESDVVRLLEKEGNILTHRHDFNSENYIAKKTEKLLASTPFSNLLRKREQMREDITAVVERVKTSTITPFNTDCYGKSFDRYLVYTTLQTALSELTFGEDVHNLKVPSSLIAKVLLHLCGIISEITVKNDQKYHINNSCQDLFDKHKQDINLDFKAFYGHSCQDARAYEYVRNLVLQQFCVFTLDQLRSKIILYFCDIIQTKQDMHYMVLDYLLRESRPALF